MKRLLNIIHRNNYDFLNFLFWRPIILTLAAVLAFLFTWQGCKDKEGDPDDGWTEEEEMAYLVVEALQNQCGQVFTDLVNTMDTSSAKVQLAEWFESDPAVEWAEVTAQGVSVLYLNGVRGGVLIDPLNEYVEGVEYPDTNDLSGRIGYAPKSIPEKKDVLFFNPTMSEFTEAYLYQRRTYITELPRAGMNLKKIDVNAMATLAELETLANYGIIHFSSHAIAWPTEENISEVYAQTGEVVTKQTSSKYWKEIKSNKIIIVTDAANNKSVYSVGPEFITAKNDFSKDTVLFYGEFCYGYLGGWPAIVNKFAKGVYLAADWAVAANFSANWGMDLVYHLCDTTKDNPITVSEWLNNNHEIPTSYIDKENRKVSIRYAGDGTFTLWRPKVKLEIKSTETDGAPITVPGKINTNYTFNCLVTGEQVQNILFMWDFGDGSAPQQTYQANQISHTWSAQGTFLLKVEAMNINTSETVGIATVTLNIQDAENILPLLHTIKNVQVGLPSGDHHYLSNGETIMDGFTYIYSNTLGENSKIIWDGPNFSISGVTTSGWNLDIHGSVSADGRTLVSFYAHRWYPPPTQNPEIKIELTNIAVTTVQPGIPSAQYSINGTASQSHVANFEYKKWDSANQSWATYTHSDWEYVNIEVLFSGHN